MIPLSRKGREGVLPHLNVAIKSGYIQSLIRLWIWPDDESNDHRLLVTHGLKTELAVIGLSKDLMTDYFRNSASQAKSFYPDRLHDTACATSFKYGKAVIKRQ